MFDEPQAEHHWLAQIVGDWTAESECQMGPDQPTQKTTGRMRCRMLGGMWLIGEGEGESPEGGSWTSILTLGYDPSKECFVGTFIASMMTHLWPYNGQLNAAKKKLSLDSEGPSFNGNGTAKYRDSVEIIDADHWNFFGEILGDDGQWHRIAFAHHTRNA